LDLIRIALSHQGYEVLAIDSNALPLQIFVQPDLIIINTKEYEFNKLKRTVAEFSNVLTRNSCSVPPVIALTDFNTIDREELFKSHVYDYCCLPIIKQELLLRLGQVFLVSDKKK
jgi:DNA-binding response OmpR family regulator